MREAADAYGTPEHTSTNATDPSIFGAAEHEKTQALAIHRTLLQELRDKEQNALTSENVIEDVPKRTTNELAVALAADDVSDCASMGPVDFAKYLCDAATLTAEQRGPVALVARDLQKAFDKEVARRAKLTDAQLRAEGIGATEHVTLPLKGRRLRLLLYGGGGAENPGSSTRC